MKKFFTLFLLICSTLFTRAQSIEGVISFTNLSRQDILIEVDGKQYADCGSAMTIRNLSHGMYKVKVYGRRFQHGNNKRPLLYDHTVWVKSRLFVDVIINRFGRVFIDEREIDGGWPDEDEPVNDLWSQTMGEQPFLAFKQTISKESFDDSRMLIAKQVIDQFYYTVEQVKQLLPLFSFEKSKLEMAKYLYGKTINRENYFIVYSLFNFSSTKEELIAYIKNYK